MIGLRVFTMTTEERFTSVHITRQHPQSLRHCLKRSGVVGELKEVHQAELRALRTLRATHPWMLTDMAAKLIDDHDEKATS